MGRVEKGDGFIQQAGFATRFKRGLSSAGRMADMDHVLVLLPMGQMSQSYSNSRLSCHVIGRFHSISLPESENLPSPSHPRHQPSTFLTCPKEKKM